MIKFVNRLLSSDLAGKKVILRVDFNLPIVDGKIGEDFKVKSHRETVDYLLGAGAKVLLISHLGHDDPEASFNPIVEELGQILGQTITLVPHSERSSIDKLCQACPLLLLDNIRQEPREAANDDGFAAELAQGFNLYVDDAFAVVHRNNASVVAITKHLPSYAGLLIKKEIESLSRGIEAPAEGKVLVLGGAKISTKLPVIKNFLDKAERILIGGAIANDFFEARGIKIGSSLVDYSITPPDSSSDKIVLPQDMLVSDGKDGGSYVETRPVEDIAPEEFVTDIGPQTAEHYAELIGRSKTVIWNGPMGLAEVTKFAGGTAAIARAVAGHANSIVGGGDTIAAVDKMGLLDKIKFISTGGGAMLEFLAGNILPGLEALGYYEK